MKDAQPFKDASLVKDSPPPSNSLVRARQSQQLITIWALGFYMVSGSYLLEQCADIGDGENNPTLQEEANTSDNEGCEVVPACSFLLTRAS